MPVVWGFRLSPRSSLSVVIVLFFGMISSVTSMKSIHSVGLGLLLLVAACAGNTAGNGPDPVVRGAAADPADRVTLARTAWRSTATLVRSDSIVLTLPSGDRQVQRMSRRGRFNVEIDNGGGVKVTLDSIIFTPRIGNSVRELTGTVWQGRLNSDGLTNIKASRGGPLVEELTLAVREMFPPLPSTGVSPGATWADTTSTERKVEIFEAQDERVSTWRVGSRTEREGLNVLPIRVTERYEQLGKGDQAGREMSLAAQGSRSATYYLTFGGRLDAVTVVDSASKLITIPSTKQVIPTTQIIRSQVEFRAAGTR
jgi:hypothetical protein